MHGALHALGGAHPYAAALHALVDEAMLAFPLPVPSSSATLRVAAVPS
ncbi:hypothetical protein OHA72_37930 [Dactylosporangium sp. NBC_01737]|nr:hypothetical protein OHA72_37930 [Dactylosporangium sp. NBC_01737]